MAEMTADAQIAMDPTASAMIAGLLTRGAILAAGKGKSDPPPPAPPRPGKSEAPRPGKPTPPPPAPTRPGRSGSGSPPPAPPRPGGR
jgi:hypothetical protein